MTATLRIAKGLDLPNAASRLWEKVDKHGPVPAHRPDLGACWVWTGYLRNSQHGSLYHRGRNIYVHRVSWALHNGPIPDALIVCHHCDNPPCVNPAHLFLGTDLDNNVDMRAKGRGSNPPLHVGEQHPGAHITDEQVTELRALAASGISQHTLARRFDVSQSTVWRLIHGKVRAG